jgi:hypothetical protein
LDAHVYAVEALSANFVDSKLFGLVSALENLSAGIFFTLLLLL